MGSIMLTPNSYYLGSLFISHLFLLSTDPPQRLTLQKDFVSLILVAHVSENKRIAFFFKYFTIILY